VNTTAKVYSVPVLSRDERHCRTMVRKIYAGVVRRGCSDSVLLFRVIGSFRCVVLDSMSIQCVVSVLNSFSGCRLHNQSIFWLSFHDKISNLVVVRKCFEVVLNFHLLYFSALRNKKFIIVDCNYSLNSHQPEVDNALICACRLDSCAKLYWYCLFLY
jgi:hypothetical protein